MPLIVLALSSISCGGPETAGPEVLGLRVIKFPDGQHIQAEVEVTPQEIQKGMMFRDSLPRGRGMLIINQKPGVYPYWMYQVRIPLDVVWMDENRRVVEIASDAQPCRTTASLCASYGGHERSQFVLELAAGEARHYGLNVGQVLDF